MKPSLGIAAEYLDIAAYDAHVLPECASAAQASGASPVVRGRRLQDRFFRYVDLGEGCWNWTGGSSRGYGTLFVEGRMRQATGVSWFLFHEEWPTLQVLHHCDNPLCVRPDHLFQGTQADNIGDMVAKGRQRSLAGEANPGHKLTAAQVVEIKRRYVRGGPTKDLAREFGVSLPLIYQILDGKRWRSVTA